jgi:hypothetical protein
MCSRVGRRKERNGLVHSLRFHITFAYYFRFIQIDKILLARVSILSCTLVVFAKSYTIFISPIYYNKNATYSSPVPPSVRALHPLTLFPEPARGNNSLQGTVPLNPSSCKSPPPLRWSRPTLYSNLDLFWHNHNPQSTTTTTIFFLRLCR